MQGVFLRFYVTEFAQHRGKLVYEWLVEQAYRSGVGGCSVFRAIAGFGRHREMHEESFFDLAAELPLEMCFILSEAQAEEMLSALREEGLDLFYVQHAAVFGNVVTGDARVPQAESGAE
jgi:PII-like signaling protein